MPKDPLGILKPKNKDPLGILTPKSSPAEDSTINGNSTGSTPIVSTPDKTPPVELPSPTLPLARFTDIFSADSILDRDLASTHAETLSSANNVPAPKLSLTGFNQDQAAKNSLTPSFDDERKAKISQIKNDPDQLRDYRKKRVSEIDANISQIKDKMLSKIDPSTTVEAGLVPSSDLTSFNEPAQEVQQQEDYKNQLTKSISDVASVVVPKSFYDKTPNPNIEEVGKKYLETIGYAGVKDDEKVLDQLKKAKIDEEDKPIAELTSETIRNTFYKEGAAALAAYHVKQAEDIHSSVPQKINLYAELLKRQKDTKDQAEKNKLQSAIDSALEDPDIKSFADNANSALRFADESNLSSNYFPQVKREENRQKLNDLYFAMQNNKMENRAHSLNPFNHIRNAFSAILGEAPSYEELKQLAEQSGLSEDVVRDIATNGKEGLFAKSREGVRVSGILTGISQAADQTLSSSINGLRRFLNVNDVASKNALLQTKADAYDMGASGNELYDKSGNLNLNPFSIANTAGRGVGQMAVFALPTLITGGLAEGLLAPEIKAAAMAGKDFSAAKGVVKASEALATQASGYLGSYESAYKDIAAYTDDEETRRGYANVVAHANAGAEHLMSPADIAKSMGAGAVTKEALIKTFIKDGEKFGVQETVAKRLMQAGLKVAEVGAAENVEEQATNVVTNTADQAYMNKVRSASELADQFWQTLNTTTVNMLPMMVGVGMQGMNDISSIRKQGLFEVGNEPEVIKAQLQKLLDSNDISQEKFNQKMSVVNSMNEIVSKVNNLTKTDGTPLTYDEKVNIAANQFRINHNNKIKENGAVQAQEAQVDNDNKQAVAEQAAILDDAPLYKVNGNVVSAKEAKSAIEANDGSFIEIKNDQELSDLQKSIKSEPVAIETEVKAEPTIQDVIEKPVIYNGMTGTIVRDGMQYVFQQDNSNKEYVIEPSEDYESKPVEDLGIHPVQQIAPAEDKSQFTKEAIQSKISVGETLTPQEEKYKKLYELSGVKFEPQKVSEVSLNDGNTVSIRGSNYVNNYSDPFQAINRDENGYVVSVNLSTPDGKERTFRGDTANDIAYQMNLKEITKDNETRDKFEQFLNSDEQSSKEMDDAGISKTTDTGSNSDNGAVQAQPVTESNSGAARAGNGPAADNTGATTGQSASEPAGQQPTASATATESGATTAAGQSAAGQSATAAVKENTAVAAPSNDLYKDENSFKEAFDKLSPENKSKYGDLVANDQHEEADALLNSVNNSTEKLNSRSSQTASMASQSDVDQLEKNVNSEPYKKAIIKKAKAVFEIVKKFVSNIEFYVHSDAEAMQSALSEFGVNSSTAEAMYSWGEVNGKRIDRIDINLSAASLGSIAHEATHAILRKLFGDDKKVYDRFRESVSKILDKSDDKKLTNFANRYLDEDVRPEEYLAELSGLLQVKKDALSAPVKSKTTILTTIKNLINSIVNKALGRTFLVSENDKIENVRDFFNSMNEAFRTGEVNVGELVNKASKIGTVSITDPSTQREISSRAKLADKAETKGSSEEKLTSNKTGATQNFFSDVVTGKSEKFKPKKEWKPVLSINKSQEKFAEIYNKFKGSFDMHIATSIPTFRELQVKVGSAIVKSLGQPIKNVNQELSKIKDEYIKANNVKTKQVGLKTFDTDFFKKVADFHDNSEDLRNSPEVLDTYRAFMSETKAMYEALVKNGYKIEPYLGKGEPYGVNSDAVRRDIEENKHLYYLQSRSATGQGEEQLSGKDYILFESSGVVINGQDVLYNDLFRAVHDLVGHGLLSNNTFSAQGEFNAYLTHSNMYSPKAQKALFLETVSYNAWYNFGAHRRREDGTIPSKSDQDFDASKITYAPRKLYAVPDDFIEEARRSPVVYDIGGSEGGFVKAITESSNGSIKTVNLDVNPDMQNAHNSKPVNGSEFALDAFYEDYKDEDTGKTYKRHVPKNKADIVHESMVFQFISPERTQFINEIADNYLVDGGVAILEEKVTPDSEDQWVANEKKKDQYKLQYYPQEALNQKSEQVLVGMKNNQTQESDLIKSLSDKFKYVRQYWDSGNFKGYAASNSKDKLDALVDGIGNTRSEFTSRPNLVEVRDGVKIKGDSIISQSNKASMDSEINKVVSNPSLSGQTFNPDGSIYNPSSDGNPDVITIASVNLPIENLSSNSIEREAQKYSEILSTVPQSKIGVFKINDNEVSVDFNVVTEKDNRENSVKFASENNQKSIFSYEENKAIDTGGDGNTRLKNPEYAAQAARDVAEGKPFRFESLQSRESLLRPLSFEQRKQRLDVARKAGALSEYQYQKALDKSLSSTDTKIEDVLTPEEQTAYNNYFNKNAKIPTLKERISNIQIPDTDITSPYSANKTFEKAGFGSKGRPAQGNTTTIALMVQANVDFINQLLSENPEAVHSLMDYFGMSENSGKLTKDFNMEGLRTLNDYRLANALFLYLNNYALSQTNVSPEQLKRYSSYLQKFSKELGREIGQSLNTAKIRKVGDAVVRDMILEGSLSASEYNSISEAEDAIVDILSGQLYNTKKDSDGKIIKEPVDMTDEELSASEDDLFETELEKEKQAKQSTLLEKLLGAKSNEEKLQSQVSESRSKRIVDRINKQLQKTKEDIKDIINKIKCE